MVDYSIVIVNYNGGAKILECVDSVFKFTSNFEIFIVDNGSTDGSILQVASRFPKAIIVMNQTNSGFAPANNLAIKQAKGKWIILLNPDTRVTEGWLDQLVLSSKQSAEIGIVTPKLLRMDGKTIDSTGHTFNFKTAYSHDRGEGETDLGQYDKLQEVPSCCFACAAIKKEVVHDIGLLDDKMIFYYEDVDYSIRARIAGWKVVYCPQSIVFHHRGGLTPRVPNPVQREAVAYRLRIILKCYNREDVVKYSALRIFRDVIAVIAGMRNNDLQYVLKHFKSPIWNFSHLPIRERRLVQISRKVPDKAIAALRV